MLRPRSRHKRLTHRVKRTGTDIAVDDPDAAERKAPQSGAGTGLGRTVGRNFALNWSADALSHRAGSRSSCRLGMNVGRRLYTVRGQVSFPYAYRRKCALMGA